jgi:hypothetical protein
MLIESKHLKEIKESALLVYNETGVTQKNSESFLALCYLQATIRFCSKYSLQIGELEFELPTKPKQAD